MNNIISVTYCYKNNCCKISFLQDIQKRCGRESVDFADIRNDIFDTIKPTVPGHITAADIIKW